MSTRLHLPAVEAAVAEAGGLTAADMPLVQLVRVLARQVDAAGSAGPSTRLAAAYLTAVRTLMARLGPPVGAEGSPKLAQLRAAVRVRSEPVRSSRNRTHRRARP